GVGGALLVGEDGDEARVAGVEVEVALAGVVEIGLLEHERHAQHALPEVDRGLAVGADQRALVKALALDLSHGSSVAAMTPDHAAGLTQVVVLGAGFAGWYLTTRPSE